MVGATEIGYSLSLIDRAKKRLDYQRVVAARLGFNSEPSHAALVRDLCLAMQAKVNALELRHADLVRNA